MQDDFRLQRRAAKRRRQRRRRAATLALLAGIAVAAAVGLLSAGTPRAPARRTVAVRHVKRLRRRRAPRVGTRIASVPILMYHVIGEPPANAPFPGLYVAPSEFAGQMNALAAAGFRAVTLDAVARNWVARTPLPSAHPIVISFDNGYRSQYTKAFPVLRRMHWPAVENLQLSGLGPAEGGILPREIRALVHAGWELDTQGFRHADLPTLDALSLRHEVFDARVEIRRRYHVPVHWFCYPSGHYDETVIAAVKAAGYEGATTVVPGWATWTDDRYRLPRLRVLGGTAPSSLLALISGTRSPA